MKYLNAVMDQRLLEANAEIDRLRKELKYRAVLIDNACRVLQMLEEHMATRSDTVLVKPIIRVLAAALGAKLAPEDNV